MSIVLQVGIAAALTSYTYFFYDDWFFIAQARRVPFGIHYLRMGLFEHFSPVSRLLDKLLVYGSTVSFTLAHSLELLLYAAAIAAFVFVVRTILGPAGRRSRSPSCSDSRCFYCVYSTGGRRPPTSCRRRFSV